MNDVNQNMNTLDFILKKYKIQDKGLIKLGCTRWGTLPKLFRELGFNVGAEIGVARGKFAKGLCEGNPSLKLFGIDAWKVYDGYTQTDGTTQEIMEDIYQGARSQLAPFNVQLINDRSMQAVKKFADESLDFVYIDANHSYIYVKEDIRKWSKKVKKGGIVSGHDYINGNDRIPFGVKQAVNEWIAENKIPHLFVLNKNSSTNQMPSWMYVK